MSSLQGHFLVASPHLTDPNFYRSVVLMVKHDDGGALGLILNRPTAETVAEVWSKVGQQPPDCERPIYLGGPVSGPLVAVHASVSQAEAEILPGVYFSSHKDRLNKLVTRKKPFRIFAGYAGWGAGQLEGELAAGGWLTTPATKELIFGSHDDLWKSVVQEIGLEILSPMIRNAPVPHDPSLN